KAELRVILFGTFEVPGVPGEEDGGTGVVVGQARALLLSEAFELSRVLRLHPASSEERGALEAHWHVVLRAHAVCQYIELQGADNAHDPGAAEVCLENGRRPLFRELQQRLAEVFGSYRIFRAHGLEQLGSEAGQTRKMECLTLGQAVAHVQLTVIGDADDVTRPGFVHDL